MVSHSQSHQQQFSFIYVVLSTVSIVLFLSVYFINFQYKLFSLESTDKRMHQIKDENIMLHISLQPFIL